MTLLEPQFLWALAALPLLWWLSLPPRPRRHHFTAHLAQWQAALAQLRRRPPRGSPLRFVLLALAALGAAFAAARPVVPQGEGPERLVVLLDASASMAANGPDGSSAWQRAEGLLRESFAALPEHVDVTLLRCGGDLVRRHGSSARSLHDLGAPAGALDVDLAAVAAAAAAVPGTAVWTITDGQGQDALPELGALSRLDARGANAAVLGVRLDDRWPLPALGLSIDVVAFAATPGEVELRVAGAVVEPQIERLQLRPGAPETVELEVARAAAGGELVVSVALAGDVLPADDRFVFALPPLPAPRIAWLAESDAGPFARVAAEALADEVGGAVVAAAAGEQVGLVLVDGGEAPLEPGTVRALTFGCRVAGTAEPEPWLAPSGIDWARDTPWTRGLDLSELRVDRAWRGVLPEGTPLCWADGPDGREPLAVVAAGRVPSVHFAFRLQDGNLPLLAAFPQLLRRAFVLGYGEAAEVGPRTAPPPEGEQDLRASASGPDRALPTFAEPPRELARWFVLAGLAALALRAFVR